MEKKMEHDMEIGGYKGIRSRPVMNRWVASLLL